MNIYQTEIEQTEVIKKWLKQYGYWIAFIILAILFIVGGQHLWTQHTQKLESQASDRYQQLMLSFANGDDTLVNTQADDLIAHYPQTIYAQAAALTQAKLSVLHRQYPQALSHLNYVIIHGKNTAFRQVARLRSAKILLNEQQYEKALSLLETVDDSAYLAAIDEIKGDIYIALNDPAKARTFYLKAMKSFSKAGLTSPFVEMKFNEITP